jgi:serine/threonine-protein kinase
MPDPSRAGADMPDPSGLASLADAATAPGDVPTAGPEVRRAAAEGDATAFPNIRGYAVTGPLGRGGMGIVWRAVQLSTNRPVALKVLGPGLFANPAARARFAQEVRLHARLDHPAVARVYESGVRDGLYFYALELVDGGVPLDRYVREHKLGRREVVALMRIVCEGVQHAHQRLVVHRDLKPANILMLPDGQPNWSTATTPT